jgi:aldose sugar dehydrogenase
MPASRGLMLILLVAACLAIAACGGGEDEERAETAPPPPVETEGDTTRPQRAEERDLARADGEPRVETVATGLEIPWEIGFLPDGRALVTERAGAVRLLARDGSLREQPVAELDVVTAGEGGLLGLAIDPDFAENSYVYLYRTTEDGNEVLRARFEDGELSDRTTLVDGIPAAPIHDGGRLRFGPDERLYFTTGDAGRAQLSQEDGLAGKVLRYSPARYRGEGGEPETFTTGHRNPQGLAWQPETDRLISTEHGPVGDDEVNWLREGRNYGWPEAQGEDHGRFQAPLVVYGDAIAPSGGTFVTLPGSAWTGDMLFGALVGEHIRRLSFDGSEVTRDEPLFAGRFGRVRTVVEAPDGSLYALTSNRDGRGSPGDEDDRILRIVPPAG